MTLGTRCVGPLLPRWWQRVINVTHRVPDTKKDIPEEQGRAGTNPTAPAPKMSIEIAEPHQQDTRDLPCNDPR
jgi:hypothetical protein